MNSVEWKKLRTTNPRTLMVWMEGCGLDMEKMCRLDNFRFIESFVVTKIVTIFYPLQNYNIQEDNYWLARVKLSVCLFVCLKKLRKKNNHQNTRI